VREHTEALDPPRALWVPFMLGRPLGAPGDAGFQRKVVLATLALLARERGPVLEDFPEDAPGEAGAAAPMACPVSFARDASDGTRAGRVIDEIAGLRTWHDVAVRRNGRTSVGVTGAPLEVLVEFIASWVEGTPGPAYDAGLPDADALRLACEEVKAYYFEALGAQPGTPDAATLRNWFWEQTAAGKLLLDLRRAADACGDASVAQFARDSLIPRAVWHTAGAGSKAR
jgi:hypothetical protein